MAKTFQFTQLNAFNLLSILNPDSEVLVYTPLGLNVSSQKFDANGNATSQTADTNELLIGYNTTAVPPLSLGVVGIDVLVKNGNSSTDSLRATNGNDIVYWDYATLFNLLPLSVPLGVAAVSRYNLPAAGQDEAIEVFDLGDGRDILNLTHSSQQFLVSGLLVDPSAYAFAATAYGGGGDDILWSGHQPDALPDDPGDLLYGGTGNDWIDGGGGHDTIYGGDGMDILEGGNGNDLIIDTNNSDMIRAGGGDDVIGLNLTNAAWTISPSSTDDGNAFDGNDKIVISGDYAASSFALGGGDDTFIALNSTAASADSVAAGTGADVVSSWSGDDDISGDAGADVLWGGAGADTIYGGADDDILYDGSGTDTVFGGGGMDLLYFSRLDGADNQFYDLERQGLASDGNTNAIVVFGLLDGSPDGFDETQGVYELDGNIMDNNGDDMVYVSQVSENTYRLQIVGGGIAGASVEFDPRDVDVIALWDNAGVSGQYQQHYQWDDATDSYVRIL